MYEKLCGKNLYIYIPSLPSPSEGPYQVANEDDESKSDEKFKVIVTSFLGLKQEERILSSIKSEPTKISIRENACPKVKAILSQLLCSL